MNRIQLPAPSWASAPVSRRFSLMAFAALVAALVLGMSQPVGADPRDAFRYVTDDARSVEGFDFAELKQSPHFDKIWKQARRLLPSDGESILNQLKAEAGFDYRRDLIGLTHFAKDRPGHGKYGVVVVEASYREARLLAFAKKKGMIKEKIKAADGGDVYITNHAEIHAFALRGRFALVGDRESVLRSLNPKVKRMPKKLRAAARGVELDTMFVATVFDKNNPAPHRELKDVQAARMGLRIKDDARIRVDMLMDGESSARKMAMIISLALSQVDDPRIKRIQIDADKKMVRGRLRLKRDEVADLIDLLPSLL